MRRSWAVAAVLVMLISAGPGRSEVTRAFAAGPALPASRLEFGISNFDSSWLAATGVPWRYRYQYLAGGVNTGGGWATWNSPPGQFVNYYLQATPQGTIPVFTYYMLLQSNPSSGPGEAERDFSNLNNASTMNAYYADFKLLMQRLGSAGGTAVVHVEPDLWGYLQQQAGTGDATSLSASVQSSGNPDAQGYPDTVRGFAQVLLHLRDALAPQIVMAIHASLWSSRRDLATDTDPSLDPRTEAGKTAAFLASTGSWDAIFNDVDDHDAAWWELVGHQPGRWWDPTNQRLPNFTRYLTWVSELRARSGLPQVVWQVPVGNQYFLTENNTCGHYQDNVAEYFLGHSQALFNAGLVAVLFGAGNGCQTTAEDSQHDGITNNGGQPTSDLAGGCNACNTHPSQYPDDDGGYLRMAVGAYYAAPPPPPQTFPGGLFTPLAPQRVLDTRDGTGRRGALGPGQAFDLDLSAAVPAGATAVTLSVTAAAPSAAGYVSVWPGGTTRPLASNLNFSAGETVSNLVQVALGPQSRISLFNSSGTTDLVADLAGYTSAAGLGFTPQTPSRLLDTRAGQRLGPGQSLAVPGLPAGAGAVVLNVTAVDPSAAGYLTAWPASQSRPVASNLNFGPSQTRSNRVIVGAGGGVNLFNFSGTTDVVVDLAGYFATGGGSFTGLAPTRLLDTRSSLQRLGQGSTLRLQVAGGTSPAPAAATAVVLNLTAVDTSCCGFVTAWPEGQVRPLASDLNYGGSDTVPNLVVVAVGSGGTVDFYNGPGGTDLVVDLLGWYR